MTWTRLDDSWTDKPQFEDLDYADRWHYLAMIQFCCRNDRTLGVIRAADARRCSDHPNPVVALQRLEAAGLLVPENGTYRLEYISEHVPPPWVAKKQEQDRKRKQRERAHKSGDHSLCIFGSCPGAPRTEEDVTPNVTTTVTPNVTTNPGTGRDGSGRADMATEYEDAENVSYWPVAEIGKGAVAS